TLLIGSAANATVVVRNGFTLDVQENGCTIDVETLFMGVLTRYPIVDFIRVRGWDSPYSSGTLTKVVSSPFFGTYTAGTIPLQEGGMYGHHTGAGDISDGACYNKLLRSDANNDCYIREKDATVDLSSTWVNVTYKATIYTAPFYGRAQTCSMRILRTR